MALGRAPSTQPTHSLILGESSCWDEPHDRLYFFVSSSESGGKIDFKTTSMSNPYFPDGNGAPFIANPTDTHINMRHRPSKTTSSSGLVVMASDDNSDFYVHNFVVPGTAPGPEVDSFTPASGPVNSSVVISGADFLGATAVRFNGKNAAASVSIPIHKLPRPCRWELLAARFR